MRKYMYDFSATTKHGDADPVYMCGGCLATMLDKKPLQKGERVYNDCDDDIACDMCGKE